MKNGDKKPEDILAAALFLVVQISLMMDPYIHLEHTEEVADLSPQTLSSDGFCSWIFF